MVFISSQFEFSVTLSSIFFFSLSPLLLILPLCICWSVDSAAHFSETVHFSLSVASACTVSIDIFKFVNYFYCLFESTIKHP